MNPLRSPAFVITESRQGATVTMELHGELDLAAATRVSTEFRQLLATNPATVIADLRGLSFMDAYGMRTLSALRSSCQEQGRQVVLVRGPPAVQRLFTLCDLEPTFEFADSVAQALELTGATDDPRAGTDTRGRTRSAPGCVHHRHLTLAPVDSPSADIG